MKGLSDYVVSRFYGAIFNTQRRIDEMKNWLFYGTEKEIFVREKEESEVKGGK